MPTIVYLIHGMGCGSASGQAPAAGKDWTTSAISAFTGLCKSFGVPTPAVVQPDATSAPPGSDQPDAVWLVPLSYYPVFDEFRSSSQTRGKLAKGLAAGLADADITRLVGTDFAWVNCLDVLLWWGDDAQTQNRITTTLGAGLTAINQLAADIPGATTRRIVISHSLGTAATTMTLRSLAQKPVWANSTGIEAFFTLANVAPFVMQENEVYDLSLLPDGASSLVQPRMYNARNECDPIPWLMPWRAFSPSRAGANLAAWQKAESQGTYELINTLGVACPANETPSIAGVHNYLNYMLSPDVAQRIATHVRGSAFSAAELAKIDYHAQWKALPHLQCTKDKAAFDKLRKSVLDYRNNGPTQAGGNAQLTWIRRLLDGVEMLLAYEGKC